MKAHTNLIRIWHYSAKHIHFIVVTILVFLMFSTSELFAINTNTLTKVTPYNCLPPTSMATISPINSGLWTSPSTWPNGIKPTSNDDVIIPSGIDLVMVGTCRAKSITVNGKLSAVNWQQLGAWIDLETQSIMIANEGFMEIGTENQPYDADKNNNGVSCQITLTGNKIVNAPASYKAIMVMGGGRLELHGKKKMSWTNLASTANAGTRQITLKEAVDWEIGDVIALTSTALATTNGKEWEQVDQVTIESISNDRKTLTLTSSLQYKHIGGSKSYTRGRDGKTWNVNIEGEVGLLSHSIKVQSDIAEDNPEGFGGHIMLMKNSIVHVEQVELYKMGQKGILGRYPFHWHLNEDKAQGSYLRNSSVHKSFNRAVTIHGTDYVTVDGVFAYDHIGHGIFFEDGGERFNTIKNNVVFVTRRPKPGEQLTPSDNEANEPQNRTPSSFWITNPNNYFQNNVAAGTEGTGFWLAFPEKPMFDSGNLPYYQDLNPATEPLGQFSGFVAHTCMTGWDVFDRLNPDHSLKKNYGWDISTRQLIEGGLFYGNDQAIYSGLGVNGQNENTVFYDCAFSDNKTVSMLAGDLTIENSLFNVDTDLGVFTGMREFFRFYDGPGRHFDCHFEGWDRSNAEMIKQITGGGATENFNPSFRGTTKGFPEPFPFRFFPLPNTDDTRSRKIGQFFKDYDGGLTGKAHTTLIRDVAFLRDGHEYRHPSWRNTARSDYYFAGLWFAGINDSGTRISIVRSKPGTDEACFYESGNIATGTYKFPLIVNEGFMYTYYFDSAPSNKSIQLIWNRGDTGDLGFVSFKGLGKLGNFRVRGHNFTLPLLNSIAAVESSTDNAYFIAENGDVYVKLRALGGDDRVNIFFNWDHNGSFQPIALPCTTNDLDGFTVLDTDGDGKPDIVETETCGNPNNASDLNFEFNRTAESFQQFNTAAANTNSDVYWLIRADNANDPYIVRNGLKFNGSQVPQLRVRARSEAVGSFQLFWTTTDQPNFTQAQSIVVTPQTTNVFEELVFDMSNLNTWMGKTITSIRLDFPPDPSASRHTFIDYIHGPDASNDPCDSTAEIMFINSPTNTPLEAGDDLGVVVAVSRGSVSNIKLYLNDILVRQEGIAPYEWGTANAGQEDPTLLNLTAGTYELKAVATLPGDATVVETKTFTVIDENTIPIPGDFEAEAFSNIAGSVRTENTLGGGQNLGFILNGNYTEYQIDVTTPGTYDFTSFASSLTSGGTIEIYSNNILKGSIQIPPTGNWHDYQPFTSSLTLPGGTQTLRLVYNGGNQYLFNLDRVQITKPVHVETTTTLSAIQDAYLDNATRFNNTIVRLESGRRTGYLMFDLSSINGIISKADLVFTVVEDAGNGNLTINKGNSINWSENNLSDGNKPVKEDHLGSLNANFEIGDVKTVPLNTAQISGDRLSLVLDISSGNDFAFASKENATVKAPQLFITHINNATNRHNIDVSDDIRLSPNPVDNGILNVSGIPLGQSTLMVVDMRGEVILQQSAENNNAALDVSLLSSGLYMLVTVGTNHKKTKLFVVQ